MDMWIFASKNKEHASDGKTCGKLSFSLEILQSDDMASFMFGQWLGQRKNAHSLYRVL